MSLLVIVSLEDTFEVLQVVWFNPLSIWKKYDESFVDSDCLNHLSYRKDFLSLSGVDFSVIEGNSRSHKTL